MQPQVETIAPKLKDHPPCLEEDQLDRGLQVQILPSPLYGEVAQRQSTLFEID